MAEKKSLAAQAGTLTAPGSVLPAVFQAPQEALKSRASSPWMTFAHHNRADEWKRITQVNPGAQEGDMFLMRPDSVTPLNPAKVGWLCHKQVWALTNPAGEVTAVSLKEMPNYREIVEAVVLVYLPDGIVPANVTFKTTKCPAAKTLADALQEASDPVKWGEKSPAHRETLVCQQPFMRFYGEINLLPPRTSKSSGLPYRPTSANIVPTGAAEWRALKALIDSVESGSTALQDAADRFESRVNELLSKAR